MEWYTLKWSHNHEGCLVEHFSSRTNARKRARWVKKNEPGFSHVYGITKHAFKKKDDFLKWMNSHFTHDNG